MKALNFKIIFLTCFLVIGIVIQHYLNLSLGLMLIFGGALLILLLCSSYYNRKAILFDYFQFTLVALTFIVIGSISLSLTSPENIPYHYSKFQNSHTQVLKLTIKERIKPGGYHEKYYAKVQNLDGFPVNGLLLLNIELDSLNTALRTDDIILCKTTIKEIPQPLNPHQFDYSKYLMNQGIYHQISISDKEMVVVSTTPSSVYGYADHIRVYIDDRLRTSGLDEMSVQMIDALLLGQKQDLNKDLYDNYAKVGTVHILAVSGLHVGILLWILTWLFKPLLFLKHGRLIRVILLLALLWSYAFIAGLSPSITRAVTMFSIISVALHLKRATNIYNTLATSAFILLLINPNYLFEVGFQLSYAAVLSIVAFQPIICSVWKPKYAIANYFWQIFGVTLAAQLGVAPLSLFYFHQFPGLFFISNMVVVPLLGFILCFGIFIILLSLFSAIPPLILSAFEQLLSTLNTFIAWVAGFESFQFKNIPFDLIQLGLALFIIIFLYRVLNTKAYRPVVLCCTGIIGLQAHQIYYTSDSSSESTIIFNKSRFGIVGQSLNKELILYNNLGEGLNKEQSFITNYIRNEHMDLLTLRPLQKVYKHKDQVILSIDSTGLYKNLPFAPDIILLQFSPKVNLDRVLQELQPKLIIADGSNYKSYVTRWATTCKIQNARFHYTAKDGAFIFF